MSQAVAPRNEGTEKMKEQLEAIQRRLDALDRVESTDYSPERFPPRLSVTLTTEGIPVEVDDVLDHYGAEVESPRVADGALAFDLTVAAPWSNDRSVTVRSHGNSVVVSLPSATRSTSGIDLGTEVDVHSREGEVLVTRKGARPQ